MYEPMALICVTMATSAWSHGTPTSLGLNKTRENCTITNACVILISLFLLLWGFLIFSCHILHSQAPPSLFLFPKIKQFRHKFKDSYQTILQKACVMEGLPLVMTQSPKTKAQATSTVLEGMMRFVSWSRRHSEKVFHSPCLYRPPQEGEPLDVHWLVM